MRAARLVTALSACVLAAPACSDQHSPADPGPEQCTELDADSTADCAQTRDGRPVGQTSRDGATRGDDAMHGDGVMHGDDTTRDASTASGPRDASAHDREILDGSRPGTDAATLRDAEPSDADAAAPESDAAASHADAAVPVIADFISWRLSCSSGAPAGCGPFERHTAANALQRFSVQCARTAAGLRVLVEDPGFAGDADAGALGAPRASGSIEILNAIPATNTCNVIVRETGQFGFTSIAYAGVCGVACTLAGGFDIGGWDFSGTLSCAGLTIVGATGSAALYEFGLVDPVTSAPVAISVDNCD